MAKVIEKLVLHKSKAKTPHELVLRMHSDLDKLGREGPSDKLLEEIAKLLTAMKSVLFDASEALRESASILALEAIDCHVPLQLIQNLGSLEFESRKDAAQAQHSLSLHLLLLTPSCSTTLVPTRTLLNRSVELSSALTSARGQTNTEKTCLACRYLKEHTPVLQTLFLG